MSYPWNYKGGTAQSLWRITLPGAWNGLAGGGTSSVFPWFGGEERATPANGNGTGPRSPQTLDATPLTQDYPGTSRAPMFHDGRVYFVSDRADATAGGGVKGGPGKPPGVFEGGVMNVWSMDASGRDVRQHTRHDVYEVASPSIHGGRIVYQNGADLWAVDVPSGEPRRIPVTLVSDFDHMRENWVTEPVPWVTSFHLSPTGDRVSFVARGQLFVMPVGPGRRVEAARGPFVRYREARFAPDGKSLIALSDESGEVEVWRVPGDGIGPREQLTKDADILRWDAVPSPDGKRIAHHDKAGRLWVYDVARKSSKRLAEASGAWISNAGGFDDLSWSPDGRWLAYNKPASNQLGRIVVYDVETDTTRAITTGRYDSYSPSWSPDGKFLWFLSDRNFVSSVGSPWGPRAPEPHFDKQTKIYGLALVEDARFPFEPKNELGDTATATAREQQQQQTDSAAATDPSRSPSRSRMPFRLDLDGIETRLYEVPVPPGNYSALDTDGNRLYWLSREPGSEGRRLMSLAIGEEGAKPAPVIENISSYELSADRKKILVRRANDFFVFNAGAKAPDPIAPARVDLSNWRFRVDPREEWRQMFVDAWRLERDYFYDPGMHGLEWRKVLDKYMPLADRATDRAELSDVIAQMVAEVRALHTFVRGGDLRRGDDNIAPASLGAVLEKDQPAGGWRIVHIYRGDPDIPEELSPLARPGVSIVEGDVILEINGVPTLSVADPSELLRDQAGKQVRLRVRAHAGAGRTPPNQRSAGARGTSIAERDVIVTPIAQNREADLRYDEWEYTRRLEADRLSDGKIGYVHLRAIGPNDIAQWAREYYPVFNRQGLIIDVRHNNGGNVDSWILARLLRQAWFYWQPRVGEPYWKNAIRLPRPDGRAGERAHRVGRRGLRGGLPPPGSRQGDRHAHLGRRDLALAVELPGRPRHRDGRGDGRVRSGARMADRRLGRRPGHRCGQLALRDVRRPRRAVGGSGEASVGGDCEEAGGRSEAAGISEERSHSLATLSHLLIVGLVVPSL